MLLPVAIMMLATLACESVGNFWHVKVSATIMKPSQRESLSSSSSIWEACNINWRAISWSSALDFPSTEREDRIEPVGEIGRGIGSTGRSL
ncbi:hypothetical protein L3X38_025253 [Prunus dulcis]|uniref:Secreted protein n=1 Tax=Prunus dulcis TaxID=3755 RepID=A0AAD4W1E4_PRUDU|nr:hypothetical protein L3X38_025253 [Prunus dulcis]